MIDFIISVFILYLITFYIVWCCLHVWVISENSDFFRKRVLCLLGSIFCLWFVNCWQKGGYQIVNCIRDFEENGLWHFNDRHRWIFSSPGKLIVYQWPTSVRPSVRRRPHFQTWISLKPVGQSWSNFMCSITGVAESLHKVLGQIGSKPWFPWQQKAPTDLKWGKRCLHLFSVVFDPILFILAGNDMDKISDEFQFRPDRTTATDYGISCPWASKNSP